MASKTWDFDIKPELHALPLEKEYETDNSFSIESDQFSILRVTICGAESRSGISLE